MKMITLIVLSVALGLSACNSQPKVNDTDVKEMTYEQLTKVLKNAERERPVLLDLRGEEAYGVEHLPHAIAVTLPSIVERDQRLAGAKMLIVYGQGWADRLPPAAAKKLLALGYQNVRLYRGGMEDWRARQAGENKPAGS